MKILDNGIAVIEGDGNISRWCEESGRIDHDLTVERHILPMIKPDSVVVDGGANIGTHCVRYAQAAYKGTVWAFEPNPIALECLIHNTRHLPVVICCNVGLSSDYEVTNLRHDATNAGGSYLSKTEAGPQAICVPIDGFQWGRLDFFKLDVEGFELLALKGAEKTIRRCRPTILMEMNAGTFARNGITHSDIFQFLNNVGYQYRCLNQELNLLNEPQYELLATPRN